MGKAVLVDRDSVTNQQINTILVDQQKWNPEYIYYLLSTKQQLLKDIAGGSATPILNKGHFGKVEVEVPSKGAQDEAARILGAFDAKIRLNHQINQTLEQMAQAIFKSWFVDFEPVKAKIAALGAGGSAADAERAAMQAISGKDVDQLAQMATDQPEQYAELQATAALFPAAMQASELGEVPEGWEALPLYDTAEYVNGAAFKARDFSSDNSGLPIVKIAELKQGISSTTKFTTGDFKGKYRIDSGDVLYSWSGSPETSLEVFRWFGGEGWLNQHIFKLNFDGSQNIHFAYFLLKQIKPLLVSTAKQKQTTGLGHVTVADMKRIRVPCPDKDLLKAFSRLVSPIYDRGSEAIKESVTLANLRDSLLPKLLSGELSLPEAEAPLLEAAQ